MPMLRLIWIVSIHRRGFLHPYMPTNIVLGKLRPRRGLKWGVPAMLLAIPHLAVANILTILLDRGSPGWFHLLGCCASGILSSSCSYAR